MSSAGVKQHRPLKKDHFPGLSSHPPPIIRALEPPAGSTEPSGRSSTKQCSHIRTASSTSTSSSPSPVAIRSGGSSSKLASVIGAPAATFGPSTTTEPYSVTEPSATSRRSGRRVAALRFVRAKVGPNCIEYVEPVSVHSREQITVERRERLELVELWGCPHTGTRREHLFELLELAALPEPSDVVNREVHDTSPQRGTQLGNESIPCFDDFSVSITVDEHAKSNLAAGIASERGRDSTGSSMTSSPDRLT
jgi:hypothetical protein